MYVITVASSSHGGHERNLAEKLADLLRYHDGDRVLKVPKYQVAVLDEGKDGQKPAPAGTDVYVIIKAKIGEGYV